MNVLSNIEFPDHPHQIPDNTFDETPIDNSSLKAKGY
jgi:hypothetical protein